MTNPTTALDIKIVSESFVQRAWSTFGCSKIPRVLCTDQGAGYNGTTTYKVGSIDNSLLAGLTNGGAMLDWLPGETAPVSRDLASTDVSFTCISKSTLAIDRFLKRGATPAQRFRDLETNIVPILLSKCWQDCDFQLAAALINTNFWNTAKYFTVSSGKGMDSAGDYAQQNPIADIQTNLDLLRPLKSMSGLSLECIMDGGVASVLARHPDFSGGGVASGVAGSLTRSVFAERFKAILGLDDVHIIDSLGNTAALGQTASNKSIMGQSKANSVLWFGLLDRRASQFDLRSQGSTDAPDGAIVLAEARMPEVVSARDDGREAESFWGRASNVIYSPRGSSSGTVASNMGFFMAGQTSSTNGGVYAA